MAICTVESHKTPSKHTLFDRATLQFTVKLIRAHNPSLALRIQNLIAPTSTPYIQHYTNPHPTDQFALTLDSYTLKRVVDTLAIAGQELAEEVLQTQQGDQGFLLHVKASIGKWIDYAKYYQNEYDRQQASL
ncbi:MAG: hypothetical protein AB8B95_01730 [Pseudohongiellaceae bacterium]